MSDKQQLDSVWLGMDCDGRPTGSVYEYDPSGIREEGTIEYVPNMELIAAYEEINRLKNGFASLYKEHPLLVANICDNLIDTSGKLLGEIRSIARQTIMEKNYV